MQDRNQIALAFTFMTAVGSFLVSYAREAGGSWTPRGDVGLGSRAERVVVISAGLILAPWGALGGRSTCWR